MLDTVSLGDRRTLTAPVSGRVLRLFQQSEGVVQPGTQLVEIGDPGALEIVVDVLTTDAVKIVNGTDATIAVIPKGPYVLATVK